MAPSPDRFTIELTGVTLMGHFRVEGQMAAGGMGSVWKALNLSLKKQVVVKVPDQALLGREGFRARFQLEIEQLVKFNHPNVVSILAAGEHEGVPFFVLDYLEGGSLKDRLAGAGGRQAPEEVLAWFKPIAAALDVLHANSVIHRDVKPGNILFHKFGQPYLSDFGIAKVLSGGTAGLTTTGGALFTAAYAAPEQMADDVGGASISGAADQYALASTVYEALGGRPPFEGSTSQIIAGKLTREPPDLRALAAHVPVAACAAVSKALSRRPEDRFPTCAAFARAFEAGLAPEASATSTVQRTRRAATPAPVEASAPIRRSRAPLLLAVLTLLGVGGLFGLKAVGVVGGGAGGQPKEEARAPVTPTSSTAAPSPTSTPPDEPAKPPEAPSKPPDPPQKEPETPAPPPTPAYEAALAQAKAAMADGDGAGAKAALAQAVEADAPKRLTAEVEAFVAAWEVAPVLTISAPVKDTEIEAGADGRWQIELRGTLETGRKGDRLFLEDREVARESSGAFAYTAVRSTAGTVTLTLEVRDGTAVRASRAISVRLKGRPPPAPPSPPAPSLPAWAVPLLSQAQKDEAQRLKVAAAFEEPTTGMRFVLIPEGTFTMGSPTREQGMRLGPEEGPQHPVRLGAYYLGVFEVTNGQFRRFKPEHDSGTSIDPDQRFPLNGEDQPAVRLAHSSAQEFVAWLTGQSAQAGARVYRLPSEAEWEHACRAGTSTRFYFGDDESELPRYENFDASADSLTRRDDGHLGPARVGSYRRNPWGLFDMAGNASEWCADAWHPTYDGAPSDGSAWLSGGQADTYVMRGGNWYYHFLSSRSAARQSYNWLSDFLGLRVAASIPRPLTSTPTPADGER